MITEKAKRKKILIKGTLQLKYAALVLVAMLVTAVTVGADFYIRLHGFMKEFLKDLPGRNIEQFMFNMNQLMYAKIIVLLLIAIAVSLYVSHKLAGPIFRIEESIGEVSKGDLTHRVYLRSKDELKYLASYFNYMVTTFKGWIESDRKTAQSVILDLEEIKNKVIDNESKEKIESMQERLKNITINWKIDG